MLDLIQKWLAWTECMKAKPKKCKCLALLNRSSNKKNAHGLTDPELKIGSHKIEHISSSILKFLGRYISYNMKNMTQRTIVCESFKSHMKIVDAQFLSGASKAWIYNNYVMAYLAWPLMIYDFPVSFGNELTIIVNRFLKKWLNVKHPASTEIFYLPEAGLNLKKPTTFLK